VADGSFTAHYERQWSSKSLSFIAPHKPNPPYQRGSALLFENAIGISTDAQKLRQDRMQNSDDDIQQAGIGAGSVRRWRVGTCGVHGMCGDGKAECEQQDKRKLLHSNLMSNSDFRGICRTYHPPTSTTRKLLSGNKTLSGLYRTLDKIETDLSAKLVDTRATIAQLEPFPIALERRKLSGLALQ
jgi:hypothetical protein